MEGGGTRSRCDVALITFDAYVRRAVSKGEDVVCAREVVVEEQVDANGRRLAGVSIQVEKGGQHRFIVDEEYRALNVLDDGPLDCFFERRQF